MECQCKLGLRWVCPATARTADLEVAHRAFLVPPHKKRGKGGRQPAADPRLDPNIDERKAKRILANRLSAARSKMKQKNQMDVSAFTPFPPLYPLPICFSLGAAVLPSNFPCRAVQSTEKRNRNNYCCSLDLIQVQLSTKSPFSLLCTSCTSMNL